MMSRMSLSVAVAAALRLLLLAQSATSTVVRPRDGDALDVWVSVDSSGVAATITPSVTTINGAASTISGAPEYVTRTSVYTLTTASGVVVTSTGAAPVATATGSGEAGAFALCTVYQGIDAPFCLPKRGSVLKPGYTYYVTWDPSWFGESTLEMDIQVEGSYGNGNGFTSGLVAVASGFYAWSIDKDFISEHNNSDVSVTLSILYNDTSTTITESQEVDGPVVTISNASTGSSSGSSHHAIVIALPIVTILLAVFIVAFLIWSRRRYGSIFGFAGGKQSAGGYGVRQSHSQRVGRPAPVETDKGRDIQLADRESWSPTQGRNVFREEIQRQQRDGV